MTKIISLWILKSWVIIYVYLFDETLWECRKYGEVEANIQNFRWKTWKSSFGKPGSREEDNIKNCFKWIWWDILADTALA